MTLAEEIGLLDAIRDAAARRLTECEREVARTEDLGERRDDDEVGRRRKKLLTRTDRYRTLVDRLRAESRDVTRARLEALSGTDLPHLAELARKLHRRARRLEEALERTREQYRGLRMRHLALEREGRELGERLGRIWSMEETPLELRANLGEFSRGGES